MKRRARFLSRVQPRDDPQAVGSALTYAKRYVLLGIAGLSLLRMTTVALGLVKHLPSR
jgi:hypothetical protein